MYALALSVERPKDLAGLFIVFCARIYVISTKHGLTHVEYLKIINNSYSTYISNIWAQSVIPVTQYISC